MNGNNLAKNNGSVPLNLTLGWYTGTDIHGGRSLVGVTIIILFTKLTVVSLTQKDHHFAEFDLEHCLKNQRLHDIVTWHARVGMGGF